MSHLEREIRNNLRAENEELRALAALQDEAIQELLKRLEETPAGLRELADRLAAREWKSEAELTLRALGYL